MDQEIDLITYNEELGRIAVIEDRAKKLTEICESALNGVWHGDPNDPDYEALLIEKAKLEHRLAILKRGIAQECAPFNLELNRMFPIMEHLERLFTEAIASAFPGLAGTKAVIALTSGSASQFCDYQCNSALSLKKKLAALGVSMTPLQIGALIVAHMGVSPLVHEVQTVKQGFINIFLKKDYLVQGIKDVLLNGVKPPKTVIKRALVDFSSPNIAKQMHVGHLRSTIIGESLCRLLEFMGHDVLRVNHLGDWGTQFGMLIAHLKDSFPDFATVSPPIEDLQAFYKESKKRFDEDEEFKKRAYANVVSLQNFEAESIKAWRLICDVSRREFQKIYERLDVTIFEKGESFYQSRMVKVVEYLDELGLLEEDDGRKIMWPTDDKTGVPLTIVKTDGSYTYDTSDMAAIRYRVEEEEAEWIIYVVDAGQNTHLQGIYDAAKRAHILNPEKHTAVHVQFGVVLGEDNKKFKTRSGDTVKLSDLLDEGLKRALDKLKEKERDKVLTAEELRAAQESVAYGCIKYADLSHNRTSEYTFSFDKMLQDRGNTAVYLLYAYTRICSIGRNCGEDFSDLKKVLSSGVSVQLEHEKEIKLAKTLLKFPDVMIRAANELILHNVCEFCYEVCTVFSEFYDCCYCIEKDDTGKIVKVDRSRILLCEATAAILRKCFYILGLKPVDKL